MTSRLERGEISENKHQEQKHYQSRPRGPVDPKQEHSKRKVGAWSPARTRPADDCAGPRQSRSAYFPRHLPSLRWPGCSPPSPRSPPPRTGNPPWPSSQKPRLLTDPLRSQLLLDLFFSEAYRAARCSQPPPQGSETRSYHGTTRARRRGLPREPPRGSRREAKRKDPNPTLTETRTAWIDQERGRERNVPRDLSRERRGIGESRASAFRSFSDRPICPWKWRPLRSGEGRRKPRPVGFIAESLQRNDGSNTEDAALTRDLVNVPALYTTPFSYWETHQNGVLRQMKKLPTR